MRDQKLCHIYSPKMQMLQSVLYVKSNVYFFYFIEYLFGTIFVLNGIGIECGTFPLKEKKGYIKFKKKIGLVYGSK